MKSIIQDEKECFLCGRAMAAGPDRLEEHHIFFGPDKKKSEKYGLKVWLCGDTCHRNGKQSAHRCRETNYKLKRIAQERFEKTHTREEFFEIFHHNFL